MIIIRKIVIIIITSFLFGCQEENQTIPSTFKPIQPEYGNVQINMTADSMNFPLEEDMYNAIKSFNVFIHDGVEYISFYDQRSESIAIYSFNTQLLVKRLKVKKLLKNKSLYKTTVYVKNFDSIFINNQKSLYLVNSKGGIKRSIDFLKKPGFAWAVYENTTPLIIKDGIVYLSVRPNVEETSLKALRNWKVLYKFDLQKDQANLYYNLPPLYQENLYGYNFLNYSYCINNRGNFVFSFPADTTIYETNLHDYHMSYYAKSRYQKNPITPVGIADLKGNDVGYKQYKLRDSYGPVYFDPYRRIYLRLAKRKISETDFSTKNVKRNESVIFFNDSFKIIGEMEMKDDFIFNTIFFKGDGSMYARVNAKDEYNLHFVRLEYKESNTNSTLLTKVLPHSSKQK